MAVSSSPAQGDVLGGRYVLVTRLGDGGAGVVWRAHDRVLDRSVALKLLHPHLADDAVTAARFRAEAAAAAKLTHPNAVIVYDIGHDRDRDYLVMELVDGATLEALLRPARPLPVGPVALLGRCVAAALGAAHEQGLVHRDIKPANVLIAADGIPKVADFGIARALGDHTSRLTTPGTVVGTARYLSPEQLRDEAVDARTDVYAVGLLLHEALTGRPPWGEGTAVEIATRRLAADLPPVADVRDDVPPGLDTVLARAIRRDPDDRYADGTALATAIAPFVDGASADRLARLVRAVLGADTAVLDRSAAPRRTPAAAPDAGGSRPRVPRRRAATGPAGPAPTRRHAPVAPRPQAPPAAATPASGPGQPRRGRIALVLLAAAAVGVVLALAGVSFPFVGASTEAVAVVDVGDHDPLGDLRERADLLEQALDGDVRTAWTTETYEQADLIPPTKDGVGIWFDLGEDRDVRRIDLRFAVAGATFEVWVGDEPPDPSMPPAEWGTRVTDAVDAPAETGIEVGRNHAGRVWLLWFTELPPADRGHRAEVATIAFHAR